MVIESFAQLQANIVWDLLAVSANKDHRVVVQGISEVSSHPVWTVPFCDPSDPKWFSGRPVQVFPPCRIRNTWLTGQRLHPRIALKRMAVVGGEDKDDVGAVPEGIDKELFVLGLCAPGALALCYLDVLIIPAFN